MTVERRPKAAANVDFFQDNNFLAGAGDINDSTGSVPFSKTKIMVKGSPLNLEGKRMEYRRSLSQGKRIFSASYLSFEGLFLLVCLTVSLLLLPLVLPPLPPPPFMLLLLPICIMALLMFLAFMPSNALDVTTYTYL
ncbi:hypothetical protein ACH5RR_032373 [Cinchona calisaya]|uniref:ARGOS-like protein n=1 Tax=Cinchona calisaya TaxID=153742 RepID=A0ABD2YHX8_9GENT